MQEMLSQIFMKLSSVFFKFLQKKKTLFWGVKRYYAISCLQYFSGLYDDKNLIKLMEWIDISRLVPMKGQKLQNIPPKVLFQPLSSTNLSEFRGRSKKAIKNIKFAP